MPRISVIVPAYNAEKYIEKCVSSVLSQSFSDLELIVVNDGSKDATAEIVSAMAEKDARVRLINQPNAGVSAARNAGLSAAAGELIAFVDADDWLRPDAYETMISALDASPAQTVMCNFAAVMPDGAEVPYGNKIPGGLYSEEETRRLIVDDLLCRRLEARFNGFIWLYLFSAAAIREGNIRFSGAYLEDELFLIEYFARPQKLCVTDAELYCYYQNPASVTRRYLKDFENTFKNSLNIKRALVSERGIPVAKDWEYTTLWAGLLIAVGNEFAPGNPRGASERKRELKRLCRESIFAPAVREYKPGGMGRNKKIVASLIRMRAYGALSLLYALKNRNRS
jgi:glycosyltransferase EpsJ